MLSVQFLPRDKPLQENQKYLAAAMTANGMAETVTGKVIVTGTETADEGNPLLGVKAWQRPVTHRLYLPTVDYKPAAGSAAACAFAQAAL